MTVPQEINSFGWYNETLQYRQDYSVRAPPSSEQSDQIKQI